MARIIGIGETVYTIRLRDGVPQTGAPGGDIFDALIQLGEQGLDASLISEVGDDRLGKKILAFMQAKGVKTDYMCTFYEGRTALCMSHLEPDGSVDLDYYRLYPQAGRLDVVWPRIDPNDFLLVGGKYVLEPAVSSIVDDLVGYALDRKAILLYDTGLQRLGKGENVLLMPQIIECYEKADIVVMDDSDALQLYKTADATQVYRNHIAFYAPIFVLVHPDGSYSLRTPSQSLELSGASHSAIVASLVSTLHEAGVTKEELKAFRF